MSTSTAFIGYSPMFDPNRHSDYHLICLLLCPRCRTIEFPGCAVHHQLLSVRRPTHPHMGCLACEVALREAERRNVGSARAQPRQQPRRREEEKDADADDDDAVSVIRSHSDADELSDDERDDDDTEDVADEDDITAELSVLREPLPPFSQLLSVPMQSVGVAATDTSLPWQQACRFCKVQKCDKLQIILSDAEAYALKRAFGNIDGVPPINDDSNNIAEPTQQSPSWFIDFVSCNQCHTTRFVTENDHVTTATREQVHQYTSHHTSTCSGSGIKFTGKLCREEMEYLTRQLPTTPYLPLLPSQRLQQSKTHQQFTPVKPVHSLVVCDRCHVSPLIGDRYKCNVCLDYDLCESCEALQHKQPTRPGSIHLPSHPMIRIRKPLHTGLYTLSLGDKTGYEPSLFIDTTTAEEFTCAICLCVCRDGKVTDCNHYFCQSCLSKSSMLRLQCPLDRLSLRPNILHHLSAHDRDLRRTISDMNVRCLHYTAGCTWNGKLSDMEQHIMESCQWKQCPFARYGCAHLINKADDESNNDSPTALVTSRSSFDSHNHLFLVESEVATMRDSITRLTDLTNELFRQTIPSLERVAYFSSSIHTLDAALNAINEKNARRDELLELLAEKEKIRTERDIATQRLLSQYVPRIPALLRAIEFSDVMATTFIVFGGAPLLVCAIIIPHLESWIISKPAENATVSNSAGTNNVVTSNEATQNRAN